jgi:hypothetical protein
LKTPLPSFSNTKKKTRRDAGDADVAPGFALVSPMRTGRQDFCHGAFFAGGSRDGFQARVRHLDFHVHTRFHRRFNRRHNP